MKRITSLIIALVLAASVLAGCGAGRNNTPQTTAAPEETTAAPEETTTAASETEEQAETESQEAAEAAPIEDGVYLASFDTDSSMFHVNEANEGKGILTVEDGKMTIHVSLVSQKILNLFAGLAEDAEKPGAELLEPTIDTVTYSDGMTEEVFGFDIPVPYLDEEFDCAIIGEKGKWYDHKVSVSNPEPYEGGESEEGAAAEIADGVYHIDVTLEGGSGKASVESPCEFRASGGKYIAVITWSSPHYDFMIVGGEKYLPVNTEGNSVFEIPVTVLDEKMEVQADTVAMSEPHLIDYTLQFDSASITQ